MGYNGWSNRPTWAMILNLSNDEEVYKRTEQRVRSVANGLFADEQFDEAFSNALAPALRSEAIRMRAEGLLYDFREGGNMNMNEVDWLEIAETYELREYS